MRVLLTWGSKRGGTEGVARIAAEALAKEGVEVDLVPAREAMTKTGFDAVIVGGALYAGMWQRDARTFVIRRSRDLRRVPVWFFSSGPLDDSAARGDIPPTPQVEMLMERVGALGHATFGGRLPPDARGFPASAMAKTRAGDFRDPARIAAWARGIARALPTARPRVATTQPGASAARLVGYGVAGWAACALAMAGLLAVTSPGVAVALHAIVAPVVFALVARRYFRARGARAPLATAAAFVAITALLDLVVVAGVFGQGLTMFRSVFGTWLPLALVFLVTWTMGSLRWIAAPPSAPAPHAGT